MVPAAVAILAAMIGMIPPLLKSEPPAPLSGKSLPVQVWNGPSLMNYVPSGNTRRGATQSVASGLSPGERELIVMLENKAKYIIPDLPSAIRPEFQQRLDVAHYHGERNHQGISNELIQPLGRTSGRGPVRCRPRMGGLLNYYYRVA
jgi:hypothetical protein